MAKREICLPRLTQAVDRSHLINSVIKLHGYVVVQQSLIETASNAELNTFLSIDGELYHVASPVFKIEDECRAWKLKYEEFGSVKHGSGQNGSATLGDIRIQSSKVAVTGDPEGSQLRKLCQQGILEDIKGILKDSKSCNVLLNLCDVPYPRHEDLCDKSFSNLLINLQQVKKMLVVYPKVEAEDCGEETGLEGSWCRYLATDMTCLLWKQEEGHFTKFEKKFLKHVVKNGLHEVKKKEGRDSLKKDDNSLKTTQNAIKNELSAIRNEQNLIKTVTDSLNKSENSLKSEQKIKQDALQKEGSESPPRKDQKPVKPDEKPASAKKDEKPVKPEKPAKLDEKSSLKKDAKPVKPDKPVSGKPVKPAKPGKPDSLKRGSLKNDGKVVKKESPQNTRRYTRTDSKVIRGERKPVKRESTKDLTKKTVASSSNEVQKVDGQVEQVNGDAVEPVVQVKPVHKQETLSLWSFVVFVYTHPAFRACCVLLVLTAFYFLSPEMVASVLLIGTSLWFKYGSKKPEIKRYTRSSDTHILAFQKLYEREIEKLRYAKNLRRMRQVHSELKESVLNAYAVTRVSNGDKIGIEEHDELEREIEFTFKEFVTENDVKNLLYEVHYTSILLTFTVFLYLISRGVHMMLAKIWRPVRTVAVIVAAILLCFALCVISNFLSTSVITSRLVGFAEMLCLAFGLWLVTDVTGVLIEIRACIDHVTGVVWREVDLERCIISTPNYLVVKLALDCAVILSLFPLAYISYLVLSVFSVSDGTIAFVGTYIPPAVILLRVCSKLAFLGEILRLANVVMFTSLLSKFHGLYNSSPDPIDGLLYSLCGYDFGTVTEYIWKPVIKYLNDLN